MKAPDIIVYIRDCNGVLIGFEEFKRWVERYADTLGAEARIVTLEAENARLRAEMAEMLDASHAAPRKAPR